MEVGEFDKLQHDFPHMRIFWTRPPRTLPLEALTWILSQDFQTLLIGVPLAEQEVLWRSKMPRRPHCPKCVSTKKSCHLSVAKLDHLSRVTPCFKETTNANEGQAGALGQLNNVSFLLLGQTTWEVDIAG